MIGRLVRGGVALVTLIALVAGLPVALFLLGGNPLPSHIPSWHESMSLLLHRDNGSVFLGAVRDLSWLAWAAFTASAIVEVQAALRGRRPPRLRLGGLQNAAGWLVALTTLAFSSQPAVALASTPPAPVAAVTTVHPETGARDTQVTGPPASQVMSMGFYQMVTVHRGDCLWTIAQRYLGDGDRFREIVKLNLGHRMAGGQVFNDPAVIWAGWVLQLPTGSTTAVPSPTPSAPAAHSGHASADPQFSSPHPGASAAGASVPAQPSAPAQEGTAPPSAPAQAAPAHAASAPVTASHPAAAAEIPPAAVFGAGVLVGGATVALARMRRRQRQARRPGRRIPVPASAPVITAERRLRAAEEFDPEAAPLLLDDAEYGSFYAADEPPRPDGDLPFYADDADEPAWRPAYHHPNGREDQRQAYPGAEPAPAHPARSGRGQVTALRAALSQLGSGLVAAGQPIPDISGVRVHRSGLELLLDSPAGEPPPLPFVVPGGRQGRAWQLELPRQVPLELAETGDLLPGLLTAGVDTDGGYLLIDLEQLRVTTVDGPPDLAERVLATAAMELTTSQLAGWYDLILAGFPELGAVDGRATSCASLGEALDLLATKAVALRRRLGDTERADLRRRRLADPGDEDWALTLLVSRTAPSIGQMAMLLDLASEPGGLAALVPGGTAIPNGHPAPASFRLADDPARPGEIVGHLFPLRLDVTPQPLTRADYEALASLFATAADLQDVPADEPPYGRWSWPPAPGLAGLQEPPGGTSEPDLAGLQEEAPELPGHEDPAAPAAEEPAPSILRIGVMGAFTINGAPAALQPAQSQLVLALALNGQEGLSNGQLCYLLGPDPDHPKPSDSLRQLIVRTRRQLGRTGDGREWIEHLGAGQYALHPDAKLDWAEFEDLSEQGLRGRDRGCLRDALALIRGKPFTGCYHWWLDLAFTETVRAQIVDTAELLAQLELAAGDPSASARAARIGLAGDASAEQLWRALMRAEHAAGNLAGVREAWSRCLDTMADISADGEPHPDTAALYQQLISGDRIRSYP